MNSGMNKKEEGDGTQPAHIRKRMMAPKLYNRHTRHNHIHTSLSPLRWIVINKAVPIPSGVSPLPLLATGEVSLHSVTFQFRGSAAGEDQGSTHLP